MQGNPLLIRHLYGAVRRNRLFLLLTLYLIAVSAAILLFMAAAAASSLSGLGSESRFSLRDLFVQGRALFWDSSLLLLVTAWLLTPISALGAIAGEYEQRTLDLLRTTTLSSLNIVLGKLGSALIHGALYLLAPFPLLMLGYWLGGIHFTELGVTILFLLVTMLANTALALWFSSLTRKTLTAVFLFYGLALGTLLGVGVCMIILSTLTSALPYNTLPLQPFWVEVLLQHGWILVSTLHPLSAALLSESLALEHGSWFLVTLPVVRSNYNLGSTIPLGNVTLPLPWIFYVILALLLTFGLVWRTARRLSRPARR